MPKLLAKQFTNEEKLIKQLVYQVYLTLKRGFFIVGLFFIKFDSPGSNANEIPGIY